MARTTGVVVSPESEADLYPAGPRGVPRDLIAPTPAYKRHARLAVLALLGFVSLYFFLCFWFVRATVQNVLFAAHGGPKAVWAALVGGVTAVISIFLLKALFGISRGECDPTRVDPRAGA